MGAGWKLRIGNEFFIKSIFRVFLPTPFFHFRSNSRPVMNTQRKIIHCFGFHPPSKHLHWFRSWLNTKCYDYKNQTNTKCMLSFTKSVWRKNEVLESRNIVEVKHIYSWHKQYAFLVDWWYYAFFLPLFIFSSPQRILNICNLNCFSWDKSI